ncbi:hypothetical protein HK104_006894 [Borealophlyctis nickersoniae]|nr:hypothetical protein HK104_006894 [Borealophlyctis nickersoniae]
MPPKQSTIDSFFKRPPGPSSPPATGTHKARRKLPSSFDVATRPSASPGVKRQPQGEGEGDDVSEKQEEEKMLNSAGRSSNSEKNVAKRMKMGKDGRDTDRPKTDKKADRKKEAASTAGGPVDVEKRSNVNLNKNITDVLLELAATERTNGVMFKANVYTKAARAIAAYPHVITSGAEARKLDGVGAKIEKKIDELLATGTLKRVERDKEDERLSVMKVLMEVTGVGPKAAEKFYAAGVRNIADLSTMPLTDHQKIGLKYHSDIIQRVPRSECLEWEALFKQTVTALSPKYTMSLAGSFRRNLPSCSDVDVLITHSEFTSTNKNDKGLLKLVVERGEREGWLKESLGSGSVKYMGIGKLPGHNPDGTPRIHRRIDIRLFPIDQYPAALLHFTGPSTYNVHLRNIAISKGYTLTEYGLFKRDADGKVGKAVKVTCEKDILNALGEEWLEPHERM